nr:DUF806 family protein [uncultured Ligilactobacillus sp.]
MVATTAGQRAQIIIEQAIDEGKLPIDGIYLFNLPSSVQKDVSHTVVLITEVNDTPTTYGSNRTNDMEETVAINIFYEKGTQIPFDSLELPILNKFEEKNWQCIYSPGHSMDPDTEQITKVFQFKHLQRKDEV